MDRIANEIKLVNEQIVEQDKKLEPIQNDLKKKKDILLNLWHMIQNYWRKKSPHTVSSMDQENTI